MAAMATALPCTTKKTIKMKKQNISLSIMAASLLLIIASCSKQDVTVPNPYVKPVTQGFIDTPYRSNNQFADTPYRRSVVQPANKTNVQLNNQFADTPYLNTNHFADTPYLKTGKRVNSVK